MDPLTGSVSTIATIASEKYPLSILRANMEQGTDFILEKIAYKITEYLEATGLSSTMSVRQIALASQLIVEKHPHLPIKSLDVFFKNAVCGEYGPNYNRMDIPTLMQWIQKFEDEYFTMVEEQSYSEHCSSKHGGGKQLVAEDTEECVEVDFSELYAAFQGNGTYKSKEEIELNKKIAEIRLDVFNKNKHVYDTMPVAEADKLIENAIIDELTKQGIINF